MHKKTFSELIEEVLPAESHPMYQAWKEYHLNSMERSNEILTNVEKFADVGQKKMLDLGCGTGGTSITFTKSGCMVVSMDIDPNHLKLAKARCDEHHIRTDMLLGDGCNMPFKSNMFEVIVCENVIEHVLQPEQFVKEISRVMTDNGILYLSAPNRLSPFEIFRDQHFNLFGVVLLPRPLAKIYITRIRKLQGTYTIGYIPTHGYLKRLFQKQGIRLNRIGHHQVIDRMDNPSAIKNEHYRKIVFLLIRLGLGHAAKRLLSSALLVPLVYIGYRNGNGIEK